MSHVNSPPVRRHPLYPAYKDSGIEWLGKVPAHWNVRRLKTVAAVHLSNVDKKSVVGQEPVRLCNYLDVYNNECISGDIDFMVATATTEQIKRFALRKDDVLITKDSESWTDIAVPAIVAEDLPDVLCGYHLALVRPNAEIEGAFLARAFAAIGPRDQFQIAANGITRFGLGSDAICTGLFAVPTPEEGQAIADFLDRETKKIDVLMAKKVRLIELLHEKRAAVITRAVTKGLDPTVPAKDSGVAWLGEIPAHWKVKRLKYLGRAIIGLTYEPSDVVGPGQGTLVLRASNVFEGRIVLEDTVFVSCAIPERLRTRFGDILVCSRSGSRALIGKSAKIEEAAVGLTFGTFMTLFRSSYNDYLFYAFNSKVFDYQSGTFLTSTINQLTLGNLNSLIVPVPPDRERSAIVEYLDREAAKVDVLIARVSEAMNRLKELRTALISAAVTGKIDVRGEAA